MINAQKLDNTTIIFLFLAPLAVFWYGIYIFNPANIDNLPLYLIQVCADLLAMIIMLTLWITILYDVLIPNHHHATPTLYDPKILTKSLTLDILITTAGEPPEIVQQTIQAAVQADYPHQVFILDDAKSPEIAKLANQYGAHYITRDNRLFAKAGNINNALLHSSTGEFFLILDADQRASKDIITQLLPFMADPNVAMVQSPQSFTNTHEFIALGSAQAQEIFYKHICPAKNISNSVFCVGTNMLYRRQAIDSIDGIAQINHSEDIWTSLRLHEKGWKTVFVNKVLAQGTAPSSISSYFKQQLRWAKGGYGMLLQYNPLRNKSLTRDQRVQYATSNLFYLVGFAMLVYLIMPLIYLLFEIKPFRTDSGLQWLTHYLPFVGLYFSLAYLLIRKLNIATISTAFATFYPYILAFFAVANGERKQSQWVTTTSQKSSQDPQLKWTWPHWTLLCVSIVALAIAWHKPTNVWATTYSSFWALWNMYIIGLFVISDRKQIAR